MNMRNYIFTILIVPFFISGCSFAPKYIRPESPVADNFLSNSTINDEKLVQGEGQKQYDVAELGWKDVFTDPDLQDLIETAIVNNRDLRETTLNVLSYQAQYRIERSALLPEVAGSGSGSRQRTLSGGTHQTGELYNLEIGMTSYELDFFGRVRNLSDQALEQYLSMEETQKSAVISLVSEIAGSYLNLLADRELLKITENTLQVEESSYELVKQRVDAGIANELDLAQARTSLENVKANLSLYRRQVGMDIHYLALLVGSPLPNDLTQGDALLSGMEPLAVMPSSFSSHILLQRPDIVAAEHALKGANANVGAARAAFFPRVGLTASAGVINTDIGDLFDGSSGSWLFSPSISIPIFNAGRLQAELDVAEIRKDIYVARYEKAIQTAFREVSDSLVGVETYAEQLRAQKANLRANEEYYQHARNRYEEGVDSFLTLLDAQRSLYSSKQNYLTLRLADLLNQVNLYKVLGGGWKETS